MDASYKIQRGIHVHLIQFFMCPEFWVHITPEGLRFLSQRGRGSIAERNALSLGIETMGGVFTKLIGDTTHCHW